MEKKKKIFKEEVFITFFVPSEDKRKRVTKIKNKSVQ
jgi:hypothetical protein